VGKETAPPKRSRWSVFWPACAQELRLREDAPARPAVLVRAEVRRLLALRLVLARFAGVRFAVLRFAVLRFAVLRLAVLRLAAVARLAVVRFAVARLAAVRLAAGRDRLDLEEPAVADLAARSSCFSASFRIFPTRFSASFAAWLASLFRSLLRSLSTFRTLVSISLVICCIDFWIDDALPREEVRALRALFAISFACFSASLTSFLISRCKSLRALRTVF
jgi:hypothetical protein